MLDYTCTCTSLVLAYVYVHVCYKTLYDVLRISCQELQASLCTSCLMCIAFFKNFVVHMCIKIC